MNKALAFWFEMVLWKRILIALVLGGVVGALVGDSIVNISWVGALFVRLIKMLIVPLVFVTLVSGVVSMHDPKRLGSIGGRAIILYLGTTLAAIAIGLVLAVIVRPGVGIDLSSASPAEFQAPIDLKDRLLSIVPVNPFAAFAQADLLAIIFFALLTGAGLLMIGEKGRPLAANFESATELMLKMTGLVMEFAPFGVFALVAVVMGTTGPQTFVYLFLLSIVVLVGCALQVFVTQVLLLKLLARLPVLPFLRGVREAQLVAFSTSSSSATLPASLSAAEHNLGIKPAVASSVLPLGATINMDGTALYVGVVTIFSTQAFGIPLDFSDYVLIGLTTTLVSVGTASVPSASLFLLAAVLESVGMSPAQTALVVGFILPFDRVLDMTRTVVNVTGDLCVATIVARWEGEIDTDIYKARPVE
ncbi:dicarboxylate/amino acid:cation symporter [Hyphomonas johnsonii]|uniref:Proton/glutamate symporter n=1 Tax=Hyphomonas johnsonii MHS-2 TaxID=1280950 RepID=A0A059FBL9_9PROT|nr:dicarboxylate/amino acid:cation symporter [Hyphomonas johnsonii]KCZ87956.1 proton/glutamate symporter [Hyphomonas johnsonii MHS-2]